MMNTLGEKIRVYRKEKGLTLKQLGRAINVEENTMHGYESGRTIPNDDVIKAIANALGVDFALLLPSPRDLLRVEGLTTVSDKLMEEVYEEIPENVYSWFDQFKGLNEEVGYPARYKEAYGFLQLEEYWHTDMPEGIISGYEFKPSDTVLNNLRQTAALIEKLETHVHVFVGDGTGPEGSHELAIFFPFGTSNDMYDKVQDSYSYALKRISA
jgi:transcriptional regulator with XRE-family HTH domain